MAVLLTPPYLQFFDNDGNPLSFGKVYTYAAGTTTLKETYTNAEDAIPTTNPVILDGAGRATLWGIGSYKIRVYDAQDNFIRETDDVTSFNATTETTEGYFEAFSGDSQTQLFTLSENLGTDENALFIFAELECVKNGKFSSDTDWSKGAGWVIGSGVATATTASSALEQTSAITLAQGKVYEVVYTITRTAGSVIVSVGGTNGTSRSAAGTYTETIIAGSTQAIAVTGSGFTGTIDNLSIREGGGTKYIPPSFYTIAGDQLTFVVPPAIGTNNVNVTAPYTLIGAAGAAQVAADDAIAAKSAAEAAQLAAETAQTAAELAQTNAEASETNAATSASNASDSADAAAASAALLGDEVEYAEEWAQNPEDDPVSVAAGGDNSTTFSALHWAAKAEGFANSINLPALGAADTVLQVNAGGTALEYGKIAAGNIVDATITVGKLTSGAATDGQVLTADGAGGVAWEDAGGGGGWVPIQTQTVSSAVSSVDFTSGIDGTYKAYAVKVTGLKTSSDGDTVYLRTSSNTGSSFDSGATDYSASLFGAKAGDTAMTVQGSTGTSQVALGTASRLGNASNESFNCIIYLEDPSNSSLDTAFNGLSSFSDFSGGSASPIWDCEFSGKRLSTAIVDAIRFKLGSGNITAGTFTLYGLAGA